MYNAESHGNRLHAGARLGCGWQRYAFSSLQKHVCEH